MKERFIDIYRTHISREGSEKLLDYLMRSDFFDAPASTKYHLCEAGGLVKHSIHVYERLLDLCKNEAQKDNGFVLPSDETIAICGLLHDICKTGFYSISYKNQKNDKGEWEKVPVYKIEDSLPYGHGEKSVYIISGFMRLTREEAMAIRWHMGFSDNDFKAGGFSVGNAFEKYPLAVLTHLADLMATYLDETEK